MPLVLGVVQGLELGGVRVEDRSAVQDGLEVGPVVGRRQVGQTAVLFGVLDGLGKLIGVGALFGQGAELALAHVALCTVRSVAMKEVADARVDAEPPGPGSGAV